jgi:Zinc-binding domain of primase-helicase
MAKNTARIFEVKHGIRVMNGKCHDCAQGMITSPKDGFEYWDENEEGHGHWFCRYCGSNHVTITRPGGVVIEQSDLYDEPGFPK